MVKFMAQTTYNVLFLCTGNSARSIMAEALLNTLGQGRFKAYSAGSFPAGKVNPLAIEWVQSTGYPVDQLRSKNWDEYAGPGAPRMDFVFTVCDKAAGESCPVWPGHPVSAHWGFEDPAAEQGPDAKKRETFEKVFKEIKRRIQIFIALPIDRIDRMSLQSELHSIGHR